MIDLIAVKDWQKSLEDFVINDITRAVQADNLEVGLIILTLIATECLSGYFSGRDANRQTFVAFVSRYFPDSYKPYADTIYGKLRDGLLHDYIVKKGKPFTFIMNREVGEPHLVWYKTNKLMWFNRKQFAYDLLTAWEKYVADVTTDQQLYDNVKLRLKARGRLKVVPT